MEKIIARMDDIHWKQALKEVVNDEPVRAHLLGQPGADFLYGMPWDEIGTVLEVGSGMGFMTAPLAALARQVVAVEAVPERALFQHKRAAQDGFHNWHPVIASGTTLPFARESFDLIALNGVFEYIGLWGEGDPQKLQQDFLAQVFRLLRPNGYLYIGIETRYGLTCWMGARDHSGLAFTSLMPRRFADWYCRFRSIPFYGSETTVRGYRTYTHSPRRYANLMNKAGFQTTEVYGCIDGYNRQIALYSLADRRARLKTRLLMDPPASRLGWLRRRVADSRLFYSVLENEVVIFCRKTAKQGRLTWSNLPVDGTVTQFNSHGKAFALSFNDGKPTTLFKLGKTEFARQQVEREFIFLDGLERRFGRNSEESLQWPRPLGQSVRHGLKVFQYDYVEGRSLATELLPFYYNQVSFSRRFEQLAARYVKLCEKLSPIQSPGVDTQIAKVVLGQLENVECPDVGLKEKIQTACRELRERPWPMHVTHGDLTLSNTILLDDGRMLLIDWESASNAGFVALDLVRLLYDAWDHSRLLKPAIRHFAMEQARRTIQSALLTVGVQSKDFSYAELLFFAQQFAFEHSWQTSTTKLLRAYQEGVLSLASHF